MNIRNMQYTIYIYILIHLQILNICFSMEMMKVLYEKFDIMEMERYDATWVNFVQLKTVNVSHF